MSRVLHRSGAIPPVAVSGEGIWLRTADGRAIIDASGGAAVAALGHGNKRVAEAIARQAATMAYAHTGTFSNEPAEDLAEILLADEPGGLTRAWFCSSGSEGNEAALKLARQYFLEVGQPGRVRTIARRQSYHGTTLGALAAGGNMMRREYYEPILSQAHSLVSPCFGYRFKLDGETDATYLERLSDELEAEFQRVGPETVTAFLAEPVVGATTGCVVAIPGYFKRVREICDRHGALLILDEVMCGMGRTGSMHAWEQEGITPDIQIIAKGSGRWVSADRWNSDHGSYRSGIGVGLWRVSARADLSGASGGLRRGAGGATRDPRRPFARQCPCDGRTAGGGVDGTVRQPPSCGRRARTRVVLGFGIRHRSRIETSVRPGAEIE
jgi:adenosylmethionine-8-amino-7-oxononanoate aminotransferase